MTPQQFNEQSVGKGDKIRIIQRASNTQLTLDVTGVSWDDYLYFTNELQVPCENVLEYIPAP